MALLTAACVGAPEAVGFRQVPGSPFQTNSTPTSVAFSPSGRLLAIADRSYDPGLEMLSVNPATGALAEAPGSPYMAGVSTRSVAFSPDGRLVAVAEQDIPGGGVGIFTVDPSTGALTPVPGSPFGDPLRPDAVAFSPDGRVLAVANEQAPGLSMFSVDRTEGALKELPGSPYSIRLAYSVAFSPDGRLLAVSIAPTGVIMFGVSGSAATLSEVPGSPFQVGLPPGEVPSQAIAFSADDRWLAVASSAIENSLSMFSVDQATGVLRAVPGSPFPDEPPSTRFRTGAGSVAFSPRDDLLATANMDSTASVFTVDAETGALRPVSGSPFATSAGAYLSAFSPDGALLAVTGGQGIAVFSTTVQPPSVQIRIPANGAHYPQRQVLIASYTCQEGSGGPGIASCSGTVPNGASIGTTTRGAHTFTVRARSGDGQIRSQTTAYTVGLPSNRFAVSRVRVRHDGRITFDVRVPGGGSIDMLETAWDDNFAVPAALLQPAPRRFVFARSHAVAQGQTVVHLTVRPNRRGSQLVGHHRFRVTLRLWVTYTPDGGRSRSTGIYGLHVPATGDDKARAATSRCSSGPQC